jgi:hypothetical protein
MESIDMVGKGIFFAIRLISKATNCCPDIMFSCLAILDKLAEVCVSIGILCVDIDGKLLK